MESISFCCIIAFLSVAEEAYHPPNLLLQKEGYSMIMKAVELGDTLYQFLGQIRIKGHNRAKCIKCLIEITENSSKWIWNKRNIPWNNSK